MASSDFPSELAGFGLTTANIYYRLPECPTRLQSYLWQGHDLHPEFPKLLRFLDFWRRELDGALHSVIVAHAGLIRPQEFKAVDGGFRFH